MHKLDADLAVYLDKRMEVLSPKTRTLLRLDTRESRVFIKVLWASQFWQEKAKELYALVP